TRSKRDWSSDVCSSDLSLFSSLNSLTNGVFGQVDWLASGRKNEVIKEFNDENKELVTVEKKIQKWNHQREGILRFTASIAIILRSEERRVGKRERIMND